MSVFLRLGWSSLALLFCVVGCSRTPAQPDSRRATASRRAAQDRPATPTTDRLKWVRHDLVWPGLRAGASLVYDAARGNMLLFGGMRSHVAGDDAPYVAETLIWSGGAWTQPEPAHEPPARANAAAVYDAAHEVVVLFGGADAQSLRTDTWTWNGSDWSEPSTSGPDLSTWTGTPPIMTATYDPTRQRVVLFVSNDTTTQVWEWDGGAWSLQPATGAAPTGLTTAAYHGTSNGVVALTSTMTTSGAVAKTWMWRNPSWTQLQPLHPAPNSPVNLIYDPVSDHLVALPGGACWEGYQWDGKDWMAPAHVASGCTSSLVPPPIVDPFALAYDPTSQTTMVLGGSSRLDGATWGQKSGQWSRLDAGRPWPARGTDQQRIAYDGNRQRLVLVDRQQYEGVVWELDGSHWQVFADKVGGLADDFGIVADSARGRTVLFGGFIDNQDNPHPSLATYEWDGAQAQLAATSSSVIPEPSGRSRAGLVFDSDRQRTIVFGGASCYQTPIGTAVEWLCTPQDRATYAWEGVRYSLLDDGKGTAPSARQGQGMAYDSARKRVVLFGGTSLDVDSNPLGAGALGDTWEWDGQRWSELHPAHSPPPRVGGALVYDAHRARSVLFGGANSGGTRDDVWDWDGHDWVARTPSNSPGIFPHPHMAYDSARSLTLLYGAPGEVSAADTSRYGDGTLWSLEADPGTPGQSCNSDAECTSGHCVDAVCCDSACGGGSTSDCQACSVAAGAQVDGTCAPLVATHVCRAATGACDAAERCDGASVDCPVDRQQPSTTECRPAVGACDVAEFCTGTSADCPADALATSATVCRPAAGGCDTAEVCSGTSAPCPADVWAASGTMCADARACSGAAVCSGSAPSCPPATPASDGTACASGSCQAGQCVPAGSDLGAPPADLGAPPADLGTTQPSPPSHKGGCSCSVGRGEDGAARSWDLVLALGLLSLLCGRSKRGGQGRPFRRA